MQNSDPEQDDLRTQISEMRAQIEQLQGALAAQNRTRDQFLHVLNAAPVLVCTVGLDGYFKQINAAVTRLLGYSEEELFSHPFLEFIHPDDHPTVLDRMQRLRAGQALFDIEDRAVCKDGTIRWLSWTVVPVPDQQTVFGIGYDLTDRKKMEDALLKSRQQLEDRVRQRTAELNRINEQLALETAGHRQTAEQLQAIYEGLIDGLLIANIATRRFVLANPAIRKMLGYSEAELLSFSVDDIHPAEALPAIIDRFHDLAEGRIAVADNVPVLRKDGSVFYVDIRTSNIRYNGQPCAVGIFHDVTERKRNQEALHREHQVLRHLLASQDRERQLIAYEIHDGLAQYLAAAIMQFESIHRSVNHLPPLVLGNCDAGLAMLRTSLAEARHLISGLRPPILDESGIVAAIGHLVHDITAHGGPQVDLRSRTRFDRLDPLLENAVYRIVQECLTNAQRHSRSEKVRIDLLEEDGRIRIEITDWGQGFDPQAVPPDRFGLDGIRQRARILGGKAEIHSKIGQGTTVLVELPTTLSQL